MGTKATFVVDITPTWAAEAKNYGGMGGGTMEIVKVRYYPFPPPFP